MNIKAKLIDKRETESFGANGFKKREFIVEYAENPQYPEFIKFELIQDKCDIIDVFSIGQIIDVHFNLKGRKYETPTKGTQFFNSLQAWKVLSTQEVGDISDERVENQTGTGPEVDDLPF